MKRILLSTLGLISSFTVFSQLYVSPNSYVFVNDQFMYVRQDVNIQNDGNFFLRNNSQLLQGTAGAGAFNIKAGASDKIYLNGVALDDGDKVSCGTPIVGNSVNMFTFKTGSGIFDWFCVPIHGNWIDGGA